MKITIQKRKSGTKIFETTIEGDKLVLDLKKELQKASNQNLRQIFLFFCLVKKHYFRHRLTYNKYVKGYITA